MSIAVFRSDYVTNCAASTSVRFDRKEARNRQLHIFAERWATYKESPPHKQHIWFLPTQKPTLKKPKELFFANA
jgi:hypothetical protein